MIVEKYLHIAAPALLSRDQMLCLGRESKILYAWIWNHLKRKNYVNGTWITDQSLSNQSRLSLPKLERAQSELHRAGLLEIRFGEFSKHYQLCEGWPPAACRELKHTT